MKKKIFYNNEETNYSVDEEGNVYNDKTGRILKGTYARNEYHSVQLTIDGKAKSLMTHRLVAEAFLENPHNYSIVDHIDRNKHNNKVNNLRWVSLETNAKNIDEKKSYSKNSKLSEDFNLEEWQPLSLSNDFYVNRDGQFLNFKTKNYIAGSLRNGYIRIYIKGKHYSAHKLVWETFNGKISEGMVIDHIDGNRSNNALSNLRLVSQAENMSNAQTNGHKGQVKISQYDKEGNFIAKYSSIREAAQSINGSEVAIKDAANRYGSSAGYFWIREDQDITIEEVLKITPANKARFNATGVTQYDEQGNKIAHYNTLAEAAKAVNSSSSTVKRAAEAERIGKGYYWILDSQNILISDLINK